MRGIEPPTSAWKADMLASTPHPQETTPAGFEPANTGIKILGLTAWRRGIKFSLQQDTISLIISARPEGYAY